MQFLSLICGHCCVLIFKKQKSDAIASTPTLEEEVNPYLIFPEPAENYKVSSLVTWLTCEPRFLVYFEYFGLVSNSISLAWLSTLFSKHDCED